MMNRLKQQAQADWQIFLENYWYQRKPLYTPADAQWQHQSFSFGFMLLILVGMALLFSPMPQDDLLRHVHAWQYNYDYRQMFDGYPFHFDAWFGFDWFVGALYQYFGDFSIKLIQALSIGLLSIAVYVTLNGSHRDTRVFVVLLVVWGVGARFLLARPTTFETELMFLAIGLTFYPLKPWVDKSLHLGLGLLMASFYHLFFIYLLPLLLWRKIYAIPLVLGLIGWQWLTEGQYANEVADILHFGALRIPGVTVSENAFALPLALLIMGLGILFVKQWQASDKKWALTFLWFTLPMQTRYVIDNLSPIMIILLARHWAVRPHPFLLIFMLMLVKSTIGFESFYFSSTKTPTPQYFTQNEHVLGDGLGTNFWVVSQGASQHVRVAPAMEIGFSVRPIQQMTVDNKVTCQLLHQYQFDTFVERTSIGLPLPCLQLKTSTPEGYKIWKVIASAGTGK